MRTQRMLQLSGLLLCTIILGLNSFASIAAPTTDTAHFTGEFTFFEMGTNNAEASPNRATVFPLISPTGRYAFLHTNREVGLGLQGTVVDERTQYFWDLADVQDALSPQPTQTLKMDQTYLGPWISFSPNDQWVALKSEAELQIRRLPSFEIEMSIALRDRGDGFNRLISHVNYNRLAWSQDSRFLAVLSEVATEIDIEGQLVLWNSEDKSLQFFGLGRFDRIVSTSAGWYLESLEGNSFIRCTIDFQECTPSTEVGESHLMLPQPTGDLVLSWLGYHCENNNVSIWSQQSSHGYSVAAITSEIANPISFSPNGNYLFYEPDCYTRALGIWDFEINRPIQMVTMLPGVPLVLWLPDSEHFLTFDVVDKRVLNLYRVGNEIPLDTFDLNTIIELQPLDAWTALGRLEISNTSADGRHIMINLGHAAILVEIDYGDAETS
jgi:hypothetical protein